MNRSSVVARFLNVKMGLKTSTQSFGLILLQLQTQKKNSIHIWCNFLQFYGFKNVAFLNVFLITAQKVSLYKYSLDPTAQAHRGGSNQLSKPGTVT